MPKQKLSSIEAKKAVSDGISMGMSLDKGGPSYNVNPANARRSPTANYGRLAGIATNLNIMDAIDFKNDSDSKTAIKKYNLKTK